MDKLDKLDKLDIFCGLVITVVMSAAVTRSYHTEKFREAVMEPCLAKCEKKWVAVDITSDWKGSTCRCAEAQPEKK